MLYAGYHFMGMHLAWWLIWICFLALMIVTPLLKQKSPFTILQKRFASGEITAQEYEDMKETIENDLDQIDIFNY